MKIQTQSLLFPVALLTTAIAVFQACSSDTALPDPDKVLFDEMSSSTGYTYYDAGNLLSAAAPSPHGSFKLRFNATAAGALDGTGELPSGNTFLAGSIIVKEVHTSGNLSYYAVIKKDPTNTNASNGWIWAELNLNGSAIFSTTRKGDGCVSCHSEVPNRDLTKTFDLH